MMFNGIEIDNEGEYWVWNPLVSVPVSHKPMKTRVYMYVFQWNEYI